MLCERCGSKPAVEKIEIIDTNHEKKTEYLCEECAAKLAGTLLSFADWDPFSVLYGMFSALPQENREEVCPVCGTTYRGFLTQGRFGCAHCYEAFEDRLEPIFRKLHFSSEYKGKRLKEEGVPLKPLQKSDPIADLEQQLKTAVAAERYEDAAVLKKKIQRLREEQR